MSAIRLRIATRPSPLALWQARTVASLLEATWSGVETSIVEVRTAGDRRAEAPISQVGGQGIFVKEVQAAVIDGRADVAVHSAKDLPSTTPPQLQIGAVPLRGDPRDCLVGEALGDLGPGALVATGSVRRRAQLAWMRPDLSFVGLRGNIATRLDRCPEGGSVVVAVAALERLGLMARCTEAMAPETMTPQVGQGSIAVECRADDRDTAEVLAGLDNQSARLTLTAERAFLERLGGGCDQPVGAYCVHYPDDKRIEVTGMIASADGRVLLRRSVHGNEEEAGAVGSRLASALLDNGGAQLLDPGMAVP